MEKIKELISLIKLYLHEHLSGNLVENTDSLDLEQKSSALGEWYIETEAAAGLVDRYSNFSGFSDSSYRIMDLNERLALTDNAASYLKSLRYSELIDDHEFEDVMTRVLSLTAPVEQSQLEELLSGYIPEIRNYH